MEKKRVKKCLRNLYVILDIVKTFEVVYGCLKIFFNDLTLLSYLEFGLKIS